MVELTTRVRSAESLVKYLKKKIECSVNKSGVSIDDSLHDGLSSVMSEFTSYVEEKYEKNSFHRLFWNQQAKMATTDPKQRRSSDVYLMVSTP